MAEMKFAEMKPKQQEELIDMLIKFFNFQKGTKYKCSNQENRNSIRYAIERADGDVIVLKNYIRTTEKSDLQEMFDSYQASQPQNDTLNNETVETPTQVNNYMGLLEKAVVELIAKTNSKEIEEKVFNDLENKVKDFISSEYGHIERKITTVVDGKKAEMQGIQHEQFETVLKFVSNKEPVFLTGPAGSGKNVLCQQVAEALGLNFYFSNAVTQEYKITGFTDAMGVYHESQFYKAFKNGGVFMLDEMDASIPEVLIILNSAIANGYFDFPAPIGYVKAHEDFRVISAGNTFGLGADYEYVGRNQLDMASLDRFAVVKIDYSMAIEMSITNNNEELVKFARDFRQASKKAGVKTLISYRAIGRIHKMQQIMSLNEVLKTCLIKSLEKDDLNMILREMKTSTKYSQELNKIVGEM